MTKKTQINDPDNYYKMSEPWKNADEANDALKGFYDELSELRKKHKIPDVLIVTMGSVIYEDGKTGEFMQTTGFGNTLNQLPLAAYAYGQTQAEHRETINKLIARSK